MAKIIITGDMKEYAVYYHKQKKQVVTRRKRYNKVYTHNLRQKVLKKMGGKCVQCGFTEWYCLQIDHIHGGGCKEHKKIGVYGIHMKILHSEDWRDTYQLLCANCNVRKRHINNENRS